MRKEKGAKKEMGTETFIKGSIKFFNQDRGFGFIETEHGDLFLHFSNLAVEADRERLNPGVTVECMAVEGRKGPEATNVFLEEGIEDAQ
jgi:CspA family cold shock protein